MWQRLGQVCESLAAPGADALALWRELNGGLLEQACRAALRQPAQAFPAMARCLDLLSGDHLVARLTPILDSIRREEWDEPEHLLEDAWDEIWAAVLAGWALRCAAEEPRGAELLHWAGRRRDDQYTESGSLNPVRPDRPVSWVEACVPPLLWGNPRRAEWWGVDRFDNLLRSLLNPALRWLRRHDLDAALRGADAGPLSALQRLLLACPLKDVRDLALAMAGAGELRLASSDGFLTPAEDAAALPGLIASGDCRVQLISLVVLPKVLKDAEVSHPEGPPADLQTTPSLLTALDVARASPHRVVAALAACAAVQTAHPEVPSAVALRLLSDPRPVVRVAAARAVGRIGQSALGADLAPLLADSLGSVRLAAVSAVRQLGRPVVTPSVLTGLLPLLDDADPEVRREAIEAAGALGPALTEAFIDRLTALSRAAGEVVRFESIRALGATGGRGRSPAVFSALVAGFDDGDSYVRECALRAYASLGAPTDARVLARVTDMLEERCEGVRAAAEDYLARLGHSGG